MPLHLHLHLPRPSLSAHALSARALRRHALRLVASAALPVLALSTVALTAPAHGLGGASAINAENLAASAYPPYKAGTRTIGYSARGRRITLTVIGSPAAPRRALFVSAIHGNERGGTPVTAALAKSRPPAGVAYFVITYPNPDGAARGTRKNARGVDLNRNFPGWIRTSSCGSLCYPGPRALSEPESRVMYNAVRRIRPTLFVTYHQHLNSIDYGGGKKAAAATYARQTRMALVRLPRYPGSNATWLHSAYPRATVLTVELPARVSSAMIGRHLAAAKYIAAHH